MAQWDRFDICEAHLALENDYHDGGWLHERPSNRRRREATHVQLARMGFEAKRQLTWSTLSDNGREIYRELQYRYNLYSDPVDEMIAAAEWRRKMEGR